MTTGNVDVTGIVSNARRLAQDARLLNKYERYASAYALAILSFEEIGKMLIKLWGLPASKSHVSKQRAVSSLLIAEAVVKEFGPLKNIKKEQLIQVANAVSESSAGQIDRIIDTTFIDKTKQFALYYHDGLEESRFQVEITPEYVEAVLGTAFAATKIVDNPEAMEAGSFIFQGGEEVAKTRRRHT